MNCEEFQEISGAYALDAVTPEEREAAQAHLAHCPTCKFLLRELRSAVALLPLAAPPVEPPASLEARIMAAIRKESAGITTESTQQVQTIRRRRRPRLVTQLLAAAAILLFVLFGGTTVWGFSLQHQLTNTEQQLTSTTQQLASTEQELNRLRNGAPNLAVYTIKGMQSVQGATGELVYFPGRHITALIMHGLPQLQGVHVYQGWLLRGQQTISIGLLTVKNNIATLSFSGDITGYDATAVSLEPGPNPSKSAPAGPVVAVGMLKSS